MDRSHINLRLPEELAATLRQRAAAEHRSLNSQIVHLLEQALNPPVDADAYRDTRNNLKSLPEYKLPRPFNRRPPTPNGNG